ncbi:MAG: hypothetical protein KAI66_24365 [Lentisphaeria bacterium]|nr:hypothetical protein [Lentisphaeria bacterium]
MMNIRMDPSTIAARLPRAYYTDKLDLTLGDVWNFEVTGMAVAGDFEVRVQFADGVSKAELSLDHEVFTALRIDAGEARFRIRIDHELLSFDLRAAESADECPLQGLQLLDPTTSEAKFTQLKTPVRDTELSRCNLLDDWPAVRAHIEAEDFDLGELTSMRDEIVDWAAARTITDPADPHHGAVYSEEDKYCFVDAIFAASCFMRRHLRTGGSEWLEKAVAARDYCFRGQYRDTGDPGKDGAWACMGIIDDPAGKHFRRITDPWCQASGVDMDLIGIECARLHGMGMAFSDEQLAQLRSAATWQVRNQVEPCWYSHHEGMDETCINVNSLAASQLFAAHQILLETTGAGLDAEILIDAVRGFEHVRACREAIGVVPYRRGANWRGGKFWCENLPDNGMGGHAQMQFLQNPYSSVSAESIAPELRRVALWYLLCSRFEDGHLVLAYDDSDECFRGIGFGNFTWCRITMLDIISQLWDVIGDKPFWMQFVRAHLRTLRERVWNRDDPATAPIRASVVPVQLVSWVQRAEWAALVFDNLATRFGVNDEMEG